MNEALHSIDRILSQLTTDINNSKFLQTNYQKNL